MAAYAIAVAGVALATLVRLLLEPLLRGVGRYSFFYLPVLFTAWYCGAGPALLSLGLSLVAAWSLFTPRADTAQVAPLFVYLLVSGAMVLMGRAAGAARRKSEAQREWLRVILEGMGDALIACDARGRITFLNDMAESLTGWSSGEAIARPLGEVLAVIDPRTGKRMESPVEELIGPGSVARSPSLPLIARGGEQRSIALSGSSISDESGESIGVVLVFRDIGERLRAQEAAAAERERLLESERAARGEAERASLSKDAFVSMVSHELRTPLNAILGWTQILLDGEPTPETLKRGLEVVARNTRIQAQLISDLLDVSRIVSGKLQLQLEDLDLGRVIADAIETVQAAAAAKDIDIRRTDDAAVGSVGDAGRLQQVIWNLLANAIKFSPKGGAITVGLRQAEGQAEILVADHGIGIRPALLPHVFERFHQGEATATRRFGGLGLGLSIARHIVELHGGTIQAESEGQDKGATFTITLPISHSPPPPLPVRPDEASPALPAARPSLQGLRVLVVEDEPDTRDLIRRLLEGQRAQVFTARSAPEALELLARERPDVLLSDIGLPGIDGYDLLRRIREREAAEGRRIPALALTAFARPEDRERALQAGYEHHLAKPVEPAELITVLARIANAEPRKP